MRDELIFGRNPVMEALSGGVPIDRIYLQEGLTDAPILAIRKAAAKKKLPLRMVDKKRLDELTERGAHQGAAAALAAYEYAQWEDILAGAREKGEEPFILLLDGIEDPHNLGAIIRTANLAGAHGVIIPKDRACPLTGTAAKASAGAAGYTPVAKTANLPRTMEALKKEGLWLVGADGAGDSMYSLPLEGPIGLVLGGEGKGLSRLVREKCDFLAAIPMFGQINSLNVSVAAGVLSYEIVRRRLGGGKEKLAGTWKTDG